MPIAHGPAPVAWFGFFELRHCNVPRYALGLLEMRFAVLVSLAFAATWRKRLPVYAPISFGLDFLRLDDPAGGDLRYASLTPAQWACIALLLCGRFLYFRFAPSTAALCAVEAPEDGTPHA